VPPDERVHTFLPLATPLTYCYKRATLTVYGNVVRATHGETRSEVLGSGDGSAKFQVFPLRQSPLTYVSAPTPAGIDSTLKLYVNDVRWRETESLLELEGGRRGLVTSADDDQKTTVTFGDGEHGARLPTGVENVRAVYRTGIGRPGNVPERQISLLLTRPLGLNSVINPVPATGGADAETRDQARGNVPLALKALDRLVSVADYEDFARTFAGIGKASAVRLPSGRPTGGQTVHVTIAGADDIPIDDNSDLCRNLRLAFRRYGEPHLPVVIARRELLLLVVAARVQLQPDYLWEAVQPKLRQALLDTFSFERRALGQGAAGSEAIAALQAVAGVAYVDLDLFNYVSEQEANDVTALRAKLQALAAPGNAVAGQGVGARLATLPPNATRPLAAQLAILSPAIPDLIILTEVPS
jgi:predicted phage baseplate assembly protein